MSNCFLLQMGACVLTTLNTGATTFWLFGMASSVLGGSLCGMWHASSTPACPLAASLPKGAIHFAAAQAAPATSLTWTVLVGFLPGDHLRTIHKHWLSFQLESDIHRLHRFLKIPVNRRDDDRGSNYAQPKSMSDWRRRYSTTTYWYRNSCMVHTRNRASE